MSNAAASRIVGVNRTTGHRWRYGRSITIRAGEIRTYPAITRPAHRVSARFLSEAKRIGDPQTIWIIAAKLAFDEGRQRWRWGPSELRAPGHAGDPGSVHEQLDRTATDDETLAEGELGMDAPSPIGAPALEVDSADQLGAERAGSPAPMVDDGGERSSRTPRQRARDRRAGRSSLPRPSPRSPRPSPATLSAKIRCDTIPLGIGDPQRTGEERKHEMLEPLAPRALVGHAAPMPDPEVRERPVRRRFSAEYKRRIVEEANAAAEPGMVGGLLRREGLYSFVRMKPFGSGLLCTVLAGGGLSGGAGDKTRSSGESSRLPSSIPEVRAPQVPVGPIVDPDRPHSWGQLLGV